MASRQGQLLDQLQEINEKLRLLTLCLGVDKEVDLNLHSTTTLLTQGTIRVNDECSGIDITSPNRISPLPPSKHPRLCLDVLLLVLDMIYPGADSFHDDLSTDANTLKSMRLANRYLSTLVEPKLFSVVAIGSELMYRGSVPSVVIRHVQFLKLYDYAFLSMGHSEIWSQIPLRQICGLISEKTCIPQFYWGPLATYLPATNISQLKLNLGFFIVTTGNFEQFQSAIATLSQTVSMASFSFQTLNSMAQLAFETIQRSFKNLISLELVSLSQWDSPWVLERSWACTRVLRTVRFRECHMSFTRLTEFIAYMEKVTCLKVINCVPDEDVAVLVLEDGRPFDVVEIFVSGEDKTKERTITIVRK